MQQAWIEKPIHYDGSQLRSLFCYQNCRVMGDSIVAWCGPCDVSPEHMIDGEDKFAGQKICGHNMLHFIIEKFQGFIEGNDT